MTIAFLGDSITCGYALDDTNKKYSTLVSRELGLEELNYGITGTLVAKAGLNRANEKDYLSRAHLIDEADIAVVFGGTNDYFWSDEPIDGCGKEYFAFAVKELVRRVKEKRSGNELLQNVRTAQKSPNVGKRDQLAWRSESGGMPVFCWMRSWL